MASLVEKKEEVFSLELHVPFGWSKKYAFGMLIQEHMGVREVACFIAFILLPFAFASADLGSKSAQELSIHYLIRSGEINEETLIEWWSLSSTKVSLLLPANPIDRFVVIGSNERKIFVLHVELRHTGIHLLKQASLAGNIVKSTWKVLNVQLLQLIRS